MAWAFDAVFLDRPMWLWALFGGIVLGLLAFDLGVLHRRSREIPLKESLLLSSAYVLAAVAFGAWTWWSLGSEAGAAFFSGYLIEKSLSLDNVFVISAIFGTLAIPREHQHRVLFWGIVSVLVLRAGLIGLGAALVHEFAWVLPLFGRLPALCRLSHRPVPRPCWRAAAKALPQPPAADAAGDR